MYQARSKTQAMQLLKDAQNKLNREECVSNMEQRSSDAAPKDVQIKFNKEECVSDMEQRESYAAKKNVQIKSSMEECA